MQVLYCPRSHFIIQQIRKFDKCFYFKNQGQWVRLDFHAKINDLK